MGDTNAYPEDLDKQPVLGHQQKPRRDLITDGARFLLLSSKIQNLVGELVTL